MPQPSAVPPHPVLSEYYETPTKRQAWVNDLFDTTAPSYDAITAVLSFGSGKWYREQALRRSGLKEGMRLLDLATGTGPVARVAQKIVGAPGVVAADPSVGMMLEARRHGVGPLVQTVGERLPFRDASFDFLSIGFALRHVPDLRAAFDECRRVLRPGGRILILEITPPQSRLRFAILAFYMNHVVPFLSRLVARKEAGATLMRYYWDTTRNCVPPATILTTLKAAGFAAPSRHVELGIFSEYTGIAG